MKPKTSEDEPCDCDYATTEDESEISISYPASSEKYLKTDDSEEYQEWYHLIWIKECDPKCLVQ